MATTDRIQQLVGERIRLAREAKKWTQEQLAEAMAIADRQTISTIESGERRVAADEMVRFIAVLGQPLAFFTDPHLMVEENVFSYRARRTEADVANFERKSKKLIETNRRLRTLLGETPPPTFSGLRGLTKTSPLETAEFIGYRFYANLQLGDHPAAKLREAIAKHHGVLILEVDAPEGISGAACHLEDGDVILLNRREPSYRRNFTLGHEWFHLLTWRDMPPERVDVEEDRKPKVEQLADAFTGNLLMPSTLLKRVWDRTHGESRERVLAVARYFDVSGQAAYVRLTKCRYLKDPDQTVWNSGLARGNESAPAEPPLEPRFVQRLHRALADGRMTVNGACELLEVSRKGLLALFTEHKLDDPINA